MIVWARGEAQVDILTAVTAGMGMVAGGGEGTAASQRGRGSPVPMPTRSLPSLASRRMAAAAAAEWAQWARAEEAARLSGFMCLEIITRDVLKRERR